MKRKYRIGVRDGFYRIIHPSGFPLMRYKFHLSNLPVALNVVGELIYKDRKEREAIATMRGAKK